MSSDVMIKVNFGNAEFKSVFTPIFPDVTDTATSFRSSIVELIISIPSKSPNSTPLINPSISASQDAVNFPLLSTSIVIGLPSKLVVSVSIPLLLL